MKGTKTAISASLLALAMLAACGHDHHATTAGGGTGITGQTTLQGNLIDGSGPVSGVQICILGANPAICATTDGDGNFSVAGDLVGQVILLFADGGMLGLCLSGVPEDATITLNDVSCTVASGACMPASIDTEPTPAEAVQVCNSSEPTPTPTPSSTPTPTPTPTPGSGGDSDGDGVADDSDLCPGTAEGEVVNSDGCSVSQLVPCNGEWSSHGDYVSAVTAKAQDFQDAGLLTNDQYAAIVSAAAASDCGTAEGGDPTPTPTPTPTPDPGPGDSDGDGVTDDVDACPDTAPGAIVDSSGCSIDQQVPCGGEWKTHGDYVSAVIAKVEEFLGEGLLTEEEAIAQIVAAAQSDCGKE